MDCRLDKWKVPASWLVAIATQESGYLSGNPAKQASIQSADGFSSIGIMQPIPGTAISLGYRPEDRFDPAKNIDMGAKLIAQGSAKYGGEFPLVAAAYNAGSARCSPGRNPWNLVVTDNYVGNAVAFNNTAITALKIGKGLAISATAALFAGTVVSGVALWVAIDRGWVRI